MIKENKEKNIKKNDQEIAETKKTEAKISLDKREEKTLEDKLKDSEEKVLRSLAEIENQRRRFEKEIKDAFEFGSFNFAKESFILITATSERSN